MQETSKTALIEVVKLADDQVLKEKVIFFILFAIWEPFATVSAVKLVS